MSEKKVSSDKKTVSSIKKKTVSSDKKTVSKSFITHKIKTVINILIGFINTIVSKRITIHLFTGHPEFKIFLLRTVTDLSVIYNKTTKTPTKVDSQNSINKLPLPKYKLYIKKLIEIMKPMVLLMSKTVQIIVSLILIKLFYELLKKIDQDNKGILNFLKDLYKSDMGVYSNLRKLSLEHFEKFNIYNLYKFAISSKKDLEWHKWLANNH
jgi:hypothetical protein